MPTYITLVDYTEEGIANMKDSPERLEQVNDLVRSLGGEPIAFYLTMGRCDAVYIYEATDDARATQGAIQTAMGGSVRTETLRAFDEDEYREIIDQLPG
mgnify:CR=1 FL=1